MPCGTRGKCTMRRGRHVGCAQPWTSMVRKITLSVALLCVIAPAIDRAQAAQACRLLYASASTQRRHAGTQARRQARRHAGRQAGTQTRRHAGTQARGMQARRHAGTQWHARTHAHARTQACTNGHARTCMDTHGRARTRCTHTRTHARVHVRTHARMHARHATYFTSHRTTSTPLGVEHFRVIGRQEARVPFRCPAT